MKKLFIYIPVVLLAANTGCKKYLEHLPDNRTELNSPEKVSQLLGTAYPQANYMDFCESLSDNVADKGVGEQDITNADAYLYKDVTDNQQDSPEYYWNACYAAIAAANHALEACNAAEDPAGYQAQKGEALVARAYAHFMLVTLFSKVYDPATASSDPGIPYVTEPEKVVIKNYERKTVAYVYEMIEKDLLEGLPLLVDQQYTVPRYHFTKAAANAFAARFYLYKKEYAKTVEYAGRVFTTSNITTLLRPWNTTYLTYTYREMWAEYAKATQPANLLLGETPSWWGRYYYSTRYGMTSAIRDDIFGSNVTGGTWAFRNHTYTAGTNNYMIPKINEYFVRTSVNASIGVGYIMVPLFTVEEVLFNKAEANNALNNTNDAITDLNSYAAARIVNYSAATHRITETKIKNFYGTSDLQEGILQTILDFKRAEYVQEGMRWFDILRHKIVVTHRTVEGEVIELGENDPRRILQIPESAELSGVDQNPR
ncbi:MAG TPA: RagB/SusD family nutrient uptake outer membrane protein [Agriterribacter sp.]|nr:RagB/SusD family nutrient uptake outer membrane protein [Agriterribacter sp.]